MKRSILLGAAACLLLCAACAPKGPEISPKEKPGAELMRSARSEFEAERYSRAFSLYQDYVQKWPEGAMLPEALLQMGVISGRQGNYAQALAYLKQVIDAYPGSPYAKEAAVEKLALLSEAGEYERAVLYAEEVFVRDLKDAQFVRAAKIAGDDWLALNLPEPAYLAFLQAHERAGEKKREEAVLPRLKAAISMLSADRIQQELDRLDGRFPSSYCLYYLGADLAAAGSFGDSIAVFSDFLDRYSGHEMADAARKRVEELKSAGYGQKIRIGCLLPLSGRYKSFGSNALHGIELAASLAEEGRKDSAAPVELIVADTASDPQKAVQQVQKLDEERVKAIIGPIATARPAAEEAQALGIPIAVLSQAADIPRLGGYVFRNFITPRMQAEALAAYASGTLGVKRFAILYPDESYGKAFMNLFWDALLAREAAVTGLEKYNPERTDFSDSIKKLAGLYYEVPEDIETELRKGPFVEDKSRLVKFSSLEHGRAEAADEKPLPDSVVARSGDAEDEEEEEEREPVVDFDAVFIPDSPDKAGLIIPQLAYYDVDDVYCLGTNLWHSRRLIEMARRHAQGAVFSAGFFADSKSRPVRRFVNSFADIYGKEPGFMEATGFDTAELLIELMRRSDYLGRRYIREQLKQMPPFDGVTGRTWFDADGEAVKELYLLQMAGSRFVEAGRK
ncbi:MAG: penicillin-binding protein activator [Desulfosalsimonadaceae bacterium]